MPITWKSIQTKRKKKAIKQGLCDFLLILAITAAFLAASTADYYALTK